LIAPIKGNKTAKALYRTITNSSFYLVQTKRRPNN
jgi:hypothetical protein